MTINMKELIADRDAGTGGPWEWCEFGGLDPEVIEPWFDGELRVSDEDARRIARLPELEAAYIEAVGLLRMADDAVNEMFRYYDGGETRGSYDGKPERNQLRKAGYALRGFLAKIGK